MNHLHIYPTSRGARGALGTLTPSLSLQTTITTIAEFESKSFYIPNLILIDKNRRILFFKESIDASLFTKTDIIFKLFSELAHENIELEELLNVDSYAEYENQILELIGIRNRYLDYLLQNGYYDRLQIPQMYELSYGYINNYDSFTLYVDGYLTKFEYELITKIAKVKPFFIEIEIDNYSKKNSDKFKEFTLDSGYRYKLDLHNKKIISKEPLKTQINSELFFVNHKIEQVMFVFEAINKLLNDNIEPQNIAVILPDESFKNLLKTYDTHKYLNFAMGFDYKKSLTYKTLEALYKAMTSDEKVDKQRIHLLDIKLPSSNLKMSVDDFIETLKKYIDKNKEEIKELLFYFSKNYANITLKFSEYLYLFLKDLKEIRIDDIRGGKVTVLGPLESRGVSFEGVVIVDFNDGYVPKINQKEIYLNSKIKSMLELPTIKDRESLQKHLYYSLLTKSKKSYISFVQSEPKSKFLYEMGLASEKEFLPHLCNFYAVYEKKEKLPKNVTFNPLEYIWSATMFKTYLECKVKFYYRYIKGIKEQKSDDVNEGKILHDILAVCEDFDSEEIKQRVKEYAPNRFYEKLWNAKLQNLSEYFTNKHGAKLLHKEIKKQKNINGIEFIGIADRIDFVKNGKHLIIDYKSGKIENRVRNLEKLCDFQMPIYSILFQEFNPELAYFNIFEGRIEYINNLEEKIDLFHQHLSNLAKTDMLEIEKCKDLSKCRYCPYVLLCQRGEYS